MLVGSTNTFYRNRRIVIVAACVAPLALLAGAWWFVANVLLAPSIPGDSTPADACVEFLAHPKGLPRLSQADKESLLQRLTVRCARDPEFLNAALVALRRSEPDVQSQLKNNLFATLKPTLMRDVDRFAALDPQAKAAFIDERIVAYNRMNAFAGQMRPDKAVVGAMPKSDPRELMAWLFANTTESERERGGVYMEALGARIAIINADPALRATFEARIAAQSVTPSP